MFQLKIFVTVSKMRIPVRKRQKGLYIAKKAIPKWDSFFQPLLLALFPLQKCSTKLYTGFCFSQYYPVYLFIFH